MLKFGTVIEVYLSAQPIGLLNKTNMNLIYSGVKARLPNFLLLILIAISIISCTEEVPVRLNGKVTHAITGEPIEDVTIRIENIICSGFSPVVCEQLRLKEETNNKGEFSFRYFQECDTEISAEYIEVEGINRNKRFIYSEIAGRDEDLSCNGYPKIIGDDGFYFEILFQPVFYVDIYAVDDPTLNLQSFEFDGERLDIIKSSHFQKRFKIDLETIEGTFVFSSSYHNSSSIKEVINFDYNLSDEIVYEVQY